MADDERIGTRAKWLAEQVAMARSRSCDMAAKALDLAGAVAATEDEVAATLSRVAEDQPHHAARLRRKISAARDRAAFERRWVQDHSRTS